MGVKGTLSLGKKLLDDTKLTEKLKKSFLEKGKKSNKSSNVKDEFEKVVTEGKDGKGKSISYVRKGATPPTSKQTQISKRAENLAKKQQKSKKIEVVKKGKKVYDKPIGPMPKPKGVKVYNKPIGPQPKPKGGAKPTISSKQTQLNKAKQNRQNRQKKTVAKGKTVYNKPAGPFPKVYKKPAGPMPKPTSFLKRNKNQLIGLGILGGTSGYLIDTKDSKVGADDTKKKTPSKSIKVDTSKITKPTTAKVKKQTLPQTKADDYTGRYIDKEGNVAYESFSDFIAHMSGKPKKRAMPEKTKRMIGEGKKLKRITPETKGAAKGVKYKAFKAGTKNKTIGKPMSPKDALKKKFAEATDMNFLINTLGLKKPTRKRTMVEKIFGGGPNEAYTLKKGRAKIAAKNQARKDLKKQYPQLMKRVTNKSGGGLIAGLYDKPEKSQKYKGNTSSARQIKGFGKARKR